MQKNLIGKSLLIATCLACFGFALAQSDADQSVVRSDAEILEGMKVYVANLELAFSRVKLERDTLEEKVKALEEQLENVQN